jgi:hypothetical protein
VPASADDPEDVLLSSNLCCMGMTFAPGPVEGVYMYGGLDDTGATRNKTWKWDWTNTQWNLVTTTGTSPGYRSSTRMVYHTNINRTVLFSGKSCQPYPTCPLASNTTYLFDGTSWATCGISCTGLEPDARTSPGMAYDPVVATDKIVVMFGGDGSAGSSGEPAQDPLVPLGDTWLLQGSVVTALNWLPCSDPLLCPDNTPPRRGSPTMDFDPLIGDVVAFGGHTDVPPGTYDDTWFFDYAAGPGLPYWTRCDPLAQCLVRPGARVGHRMVYDSARDQIFLFAGGKANVLTNDVWLWKGNPNRAWDRCNTTAEGCPASDVRPAVRCCFGLAFDYSATGANRILMFGGGFLPAPSAYGDTWTWQPSTPYWDCVDGCA